MKHKLTTLALIVASITPLSATAKITAIAGGSNHGLFIERGAVFAFGDNYLGACGPNAAQQQFQPIFVGLDNVKSVSSTSVWNVALKNDGTVWYWGWNPNTRVKVFNPVEIPELRGAEDVVLTKNRIVALSGGKVYVYSFNGSPIPVQGLDNAIAIDAHENHVLALTADGKVYAFGDNNVGQLGNRTTTSSWINATAVVDQSGTPLSGVSKIDAGLDFSAAVISGKVYVWGKNYYGSHGTGDTSTPYLDYAIPAKIDNVVDVSASALNIIVRKADGSMWGWGWHNYINNNTYNLSAVPVLLENYVDIVAHGQYDSHYVTVNGKRMGWGSAISGSLGTGNQTELHSIGLMLEPVGYTWPEPVNVANQTVIEPVVEKTEQVNETNNTAPTQTQQTYTFVNNQGSTVLTNIAPVTEETYYQPSSTTTKRSLTFVENSPIILPSTTPKTKKVKNNNGWGNGDQNAPGKSGPRNNAENRSKQKLTFLSQNQNTSKKQSIALTTVVVNPNNKSNKK